MKDHDQRIVRIRTLLAEMEKKCAETASLIEETGRLRAQVQKALDMTAGWKTPGGFGVESTAGRHRLARSKSKARRRPGRARQKT